MLVGEGMEGAMSPQNRDCVLFADEFGICACVCVRTTQNTVSFQDQFTQGETGRLVNWVRQECGGPTEVTAQIR